MQSLGYTSVPAVHKYLRQAEHLGLDSQAALLRAGIDPQILSDNGQRISGEALEKLLLDLLEHGKDPLFGLHSAHFVQPGSWSVLGYITMNCANLGQAIERIAPYEKLVGDMGTSHIEPHGDAILLYWQCRHQHPLVRRHMIDNVMASWLLYAQWIADMQRSPQAVWLEHALPDGASEQDYQAVFGCPVLFNQPKSGLLIPQEYLKAPLRQADANLLRTLEEHALSLMADLDDEKPLPVRVKNTLRLLLKDGVPRKEKVAERFNMTVRTLQRHLQAADTSYQVILDQLRQELAEHYLLHTDLAIQDIAHYLGFSEPRSFHRSFKGWTGHTPGDFRQHGKDHSAP